MKLQDLTLKQFIDKTASNEPVPGGGSVSALNGAMAMALGEMLANLTIGRKNYIEVEDWMKAKIAEMSEARAHFINDIDRDSDAYNGVMKAFKLPKETDEEKVARSEKIQEATKVAALVPLEIAERAYEMLETLIEVTHKGNKNAVTDGCISVMLCRNAILGALLNVRINLGSLKDEVFRNELSEKCERIEKETIAKEQEMLQWITHQI